MESAATPERGTGRVTVAAGAEAPPEFLTVEEFARLMRISKTHALGMVQRGKVQHLRLGRVIRIPRSGIGEMSTAA